MRYLVKARVKPGQEKSLLCAIDQETLGQGSIAGDEYQHDMKQARVDQSGVATWVETCFCNPPLKEERSPLGEILRASVGQGCAFAPELPARKRHGSVGLLRLRLHVEAGGEAARSGRIVSVPFAIFPLLIVIVLLLLISSGAQSKDQD